MGGFYLHRRAVNQTLIYKYVLRSKRRRLFFRAVHLPHLHTTLLPKDFVTNRASYYRFGSILLQPNFHITAHIQ